MIDDPENSIGVAYGVAQVPETFVIAPNGTVVQRFAGPVTRAALEELIAVLRGGGAVTWLEEPGVPPGELDRDRRAWCSCRSAAPPSTTGRRAPPRSRSRRSPAR